KVRVYELARDLGVDSKDIVDFLASLGQDVKNHMSTVEDEYVARVLRRFGGAKTAAGTNGAGSSPGQPQAASPAQGRAAGSAAAPQSRGVTASQAARPTQGQPVNRPAGQSGAARDHRASSQT